MIAEASRPRRLVSVNTTEWQLAAGRDRLRQATTAPVAGDAVRLPVADGAVDGVIGVEAAPHFRRRHSCAGSSSFANWTWSSLRSGDSELGHHLNFRDPDGIAPEFYAPNDRFAAALDELRSRELSDEELLDGAEQLGLGAYVARRIS
jgi:hypothetical protein